MRQREIPLFSLESKHALSGFDLIGFSLPYETLYTNTLNILDLAGIPVRSADRDALRAQLAPLYPRLLALEHGRTAPREIAFCSGSGNSAVPELLPAGVDTLVTGELREEWFNYAQEQHLNLYLCGHYATEIHGVRALAAELAAKFGLPWEFIATENPL